MATETFSVWLDTTTEAHWATLENIGTAMVSCGLVQTGDAGQISFGGGIVEGYQMFRFADTLQSTYPVYIRLDYYVTSGEIEFGFTISTGDSSGTPSGQVIALPVMKSGPYNSSDPTTQCTCYASGSTNRIGLAIGEGPNIFTGYFINIERTKNSSGADTSDGVIYQATLGSGNGGYPTTAPYGGPVSGVLPSSGTIGGFQPTWPTQYNFNASSLNNGTDVGTLQPVPFNFIPYNPGLGTLLYYGSDYPVYTPASFTVYGASHTYLPLQNYNSMFNGGYGDARYGAYGNAHAFIAMRWE